MINLDQYLADLIQEAGINPPAELKKQFADQLEGRLSEFIMLQLAQKLSDADKAVLQSMLTISPETFDIKTFFGDKIENFDQAIEDCLAQFKTIFLQKN